MTTQPSSQPLLVLTIGHSTREIEAFLKLLKAHEVKHLVDVRTIPRSRRNPQFNRDALSATLPSQGISYTHMAELGGLRHPRRDSTNRGWKNPGFRGFADYMQTREFEAGLAKLLELAGQQRTAIMCAEAVPWRCHRSLISDALVARGVSVGHITGASRTEPHSVTSFAKISGTQVTYPGETLPLDFSGEE